MTGLAQIPTVDEIMKDPRRVASLRPAEAQTLLIGLAAVQPLLLQRALVEERKGEEQLAINHLLRAEQVAVILNVKPSFVYELARQKKLQSHRFGKYIRFHKTAVHAYLAKCGA